MLTQGFKDSFASADKDSKTGKRGDARWDEHDDIITKALKLYADQISGLYNGHLTAVVRDETKTLHVERLSVTYTSPPFKLIKAMVWVESGGPAVKGRNVWKGKAMQIGVPGDPGLTTLRTGAEGARLILPDEVKAHLDDASINAPEGNIRAGIGYYLTEHAIKSIPEDASIFAYSEELATGPPPPPSTFEWNSHTDILDRIAHKYHTTSDVVLCLNGAARPTDLKNGQTLKYFAAKHGSYIKSFRAFTSTNAAARYNRGGDDNYSEKLDFVIGKI